MNRGPMPTAAAASVQGHAASPGTLIAVTEVSKSFGGVQAVTRVSLDVPRGDIVSVIGPNGAGKTSLLNMISGFYHPDSGRIALEGRDITDLAPSAIAASSSDRSMPASRASITITTNGRQNVAWARTMLPRPSGRPTRAKNMSSDTPTTISGVTTGA